MEAKDTVMSDDQIVRATWVNPNYDKDTPIDRLPMPWEIAIAQAQAEILFKAGEEQRARDLYEEIICPIDIPIESFTIKRHTWLWFKFYWYKWIRRKNIIGFFDRVPIIVTKELDG